MRAVNPKLTLGVNLVLSITLAYVMLTFAETCHLNVYCDIISCHANKQPVPSPIFRYISSPDLLGLFIFSLC